LQGLDLFRLGSQILWSWRTAGAILLGFAGLLVLQLVADSQNGWKQAQADFNLSFPKDHASHPDFKIEWWYYTGNVDAQDGRRFGYQLTFFRVGVAPVPSSSPTTSFHCVAASA
jgi:predicted secreted hydrolase